MKKITTKVVRAVPCQKKCTILHTNQPNPGGLNIQSSSINGSDNSLLQATSRLCGRLTLLTWLQRHVALRLTIFLLLLTPTQILLAQQPPALKALTYGDALPEVKLSAIINYKKKELSLSELKGKLVIIDFWATWCGPCIASFPKLDSLQRQYGDKLLIISATYENPKVVSQFLSRYNTSGKPEIKTVIAQEEKTLHALFPHQFLPHYIWIDASGKYMAQTDGSELTKRNIDSALKSNFVRFKMKVDIKLNTPPSKTIFASQLKSYQEGLGGRYRYGADSLGNKEIDLFNSTILKMLQYSYKVEGDFNSNNTEIRTRDSSRITSKLAGEPFTDWLRNGNAYIYQARAPKHVDIFNIMKADMGHYFPAYSTFIEMQEKESLVLERTGTDDKLKSAGGNFIARFTRFDCHLQNGGIRILASQLRTLYLAHRNMPFVENTGYKGMVDIRLTCKMTSVEELNKALEAYGLIIRQKKIPVKILVIADNPEYQKKEGAR